MKLSKSLPGYYFFSPQAFATIAAFFFALCFIENPLGWYKAFGWSGNINFEIIVIYLLAVIGGIGFGKLMPVGGNLVERGFDFSKKWMLFMFFLASLFQIAKFINVGDIPLFGNPLSRYYLSLGGFEDYPTRLLAPLSIAFYLYYKATGKRIYKLLIITGLLLNLLFLQRQEVMNLLLGILIAAFFYKNMTLKKMLLAFLCTFFLLYFVVGFAAVLRFGADNIMTGVDIWLLPLWVLHADTTTAFIFGQSITENLNGNYLDGSYNLGAFYSIFIPGFKEHGAELIRTMYSDADTAQSISVPFSYYVDFGYFSLILFSFFQGFILSWFYKRVLRGGSTRLLVIYIVLFLNALWSLRSGTLIINPIIIYVFIIFICLKPTLENKLSVRNLLRGAVSLFFLISATALVVRI